MAKETVTCMLRREQLLENSKSVYSGVCASVIVKHCGCSCKEEEAMPCSLGRGVLLYSQVIVSIGVSLPVTKFAA